MLQDILKGFKQFMLRGNVLDLAIGVVIGSAFGAVVNSLVKDIFSPFIAALFQQPDFSGLYFTINSSRFMYGQFFNSIISFLIVAVAIYFFIITPINIMVAKDKKKNPEPKTKICPECLSDIPKDAKRCAYCTTKLH